MATIIAPPAAGKSTITLAMLVEHAMQRGPAVYVTHELDGDEAAGRIIGQACAVSWAAALKGAVRRALVPKIDRLRVLDRDAATIAQLERTVMRLRAAYPGQPILVAVDYLQATPAPPGQERSHVSSISTELRRAAKRLRIVVLGVSQSSNTNARLLREGARIGADAASTAAETSQIERDSYLILALGDCQPRDDGRTGWKLSIAKQRMGTSDTVRELVIDGRTGTCEIVGEARPAHVVKAEKQAKADNAKVDRAALAMFAVATKAKAPISRADLIRKAGCKTAVGTAAIVAMLGKGEIVEVQQRAPRSRAWLLWTVAAAEKAGVPVVNSEDDA